MKNKQKQWQLYYLGFYEGKIDGLFWDQSKAATLAFQKAFFADPIAHDGDFGGSTVGKSRQVIAALQEALDAWAETPLVKDGLAGPATARATERFQKAKGLPVTGIADARTRAAIQGEAAPPPVQIQGGSFWVEIKYFTREELRCKCGGRYCSGFPAEPQELLVRLAERARRHFGKPAHNVSCLRCPTWNARSGGVANSQHMYGEAMDIRIEGVTADELLAFFKKQPEVRYCYKINSTNVHFDIPKGKR